MIRHMDDETQPDRDDTGRWEPGSKHVGGPEDRMKIETPCPPGLEHVRSAWNRLVIDARRDSRAAVDLIRLAKEFGAATEALSIDQADASMYKDLPAGTAELLWLLDVSLSSVLMRHDRHMPMTDVEALIARTCSAVRVSLGDKPTSDITRLAGVTVALIQRLREQGEIP